MTLNPKYLFSFFFLLACVLQAAGQYNAPLYAPYTTTAQRDSFYHRLTRTAILGSLGEPLNDSTEDQWEGAFDAMEIIRYQNPYVKPRLEVAFDSLQARTPDFQRALLELVYTNFPKSFQTRVSQFIQHATLPKLFAMCAEYLVRQHPDPAYKRSLNALMQARFKDSCQTSPILISLSGRLQPHSTPQQPLSKAQLLQKVFSPDFMPRQIVMYSFQRKDRDYPGLVLVRKADGSFVRDSLGQIFSVPQLARSITNLPGYLTNGNTPQGIFKMYGFGVSQSNFIGPTVNVQLGMPVELGVGKFFEDSLTTDTVWTLKKYESLLPKSLQDYAPFYESYYAGLAGRTEIIAHGTTIDPSYYRGTPYYPLTPTDGCLCTREIWNGIRLQSDQQQLVNALLQAGGASGYCIVLQLDDQKAPVRLKELLPYLP